MGDGTIQHPTMYDRDVFMFLPYQVNSNKYIVAYYVGTFDVMKDLTPESFNITITANVDFGSATISTYDPIKNANVPVVVIFNKGNQLTITVTAGDYPYLLTISL